MAQAQKTIGTTLKRLTTPASTIANLTSIGEIGIESGEIDVTDLDSPNNYKEYIAGFKEAGEVAIAGNVKSEANHEDMLALAEAQTVILWEVEFPSGAKWWFEAFLKSYKEGEVTVEGVRTFTGSLRITGKPTYDAEGISA